MEGALGAVTGLIGAGLSYSAQQTANVINMMNLQFQKENARKQLRFAQAGHVDQYGNEQTFDDALNKWILKLTPMQQRITQATEKEQLLSVTEDAKRRRDILKMQRQRGLAAVPDYDRVMADWRYNQPHSELATRDELTNLLAGVENEKAGKSKTELIRQALREGQGGSIEQILKAVNDDSGATMAENMLKARDQAKQEYATNVAAHNQNDLPVLEQLTQLIDMGGGSPPSGYANDTAGLVGLQQSQAAQIQAALKSGGAGVGSAFKALAASEGKSPNLAGLTKSLGGGRKNQSQTVPDNSGGTTDYSMFNSDSWLPSDRSVDSYGYF